MSKIFADYDSILDTKNEIRSTYEEINSTISHIMNCYYSIFGSSYTKPLSYNTENGTTVSSFSECSWSGTKANYFKENIEKFFESNNSSICAGKLTDYFKTKGDNIDQFLQKVLEQYENVDSSNSKNIDKTV